MPLCAQAERIRGTGMIQCPDFPVVVRGEGPGLWVYITRAARLLTMAMPEEVPMRVAPASIIASAVSASRIPPAALTPNAGPTVLRISATSSIGRSSGTQAGGGFDELGAAVHHQPARPDLLVLVEKAGFDYDLDGPAGGSLHDLRKARRRRSGRPPA